MARPRSIRPSATLLAVVAVAASCAPGAADLSPAAEPAAPTMTTEAVAASLPATEPQIEPMGAQENAAEPAPNPEEGIVVVDAATRAMQQRCIDTAAIMERRIDAEGFVFPDEAPELSEEELDRTLAPEVEIDDRVAGPDERPVIVPIADFDPQTAPILELDVVIGACAESGIVTEAELFPDEDDEDGDEDEDDEG